MVQWQVFLKGGAGTFPIKFFQGLSFLHSEITLPFSATITLQKKVILSCLQMNLKISHKLRSPICKGI